MREFPGAELGPEYVVDLYRLAKITTLYSGKHEPDGMMCVMEAVAFVAGEKWSDAPECSCPVIGTFMRAWNDALPNDEERTELLLPLIPRIVGTRGSKKLEKVRALMAADWLVRVHTPAWLRLAGLTAHADELASLPEITSAAQVLSIRPAIEAARRDATAAWDAARAAAGDAAWDAAWAAAWDAVMAGAGDAAWDAARDAAWDAARAAAWAGAGDAAGAGAAARAAAAAGDAAGAWDATWAAARAAAWDAVMAKLNPTKFELQQSAIILINRMIDAEV